MTETTHRAPTRIQSVERAIQAVMVVAKRESASAVSVCDALGVPPSTAHHLLQTLVDTGMLAKDARRRYSLGPTVGALAETFLHQMRPPEFLLDPIRNVAQKTGETAYVSGWRAEEIVVLASFEGSSAVRVAGLHAGAGGSAYARASGKVLLAYAYPEIQKTYLDSHPLRPLTRNTIISRAELEATFKRVRAFGFAEDIEEFSEGVSCVAVPVGEGNAIVAAFTISAPAERYHERRLEYVEALKDAARRAIAGTSLG